MAGNASTRALYFVLLAACTAFCQQAETSASALPDAPSPVAANQLENVRPPFDTPRLPLNTVILPSKTAEHYDPGHFANDLIQKEPATDTPALAFLARRTSSYHGSIGATFLSRMTGAASGIVLARDDEGNRRLNTPYLLRVLTASVAHSAYRPYWRRSATQPISDFGSTVGSDAGMNVLHEFEPGLMQLMKSHEPKFVSRIEQHVSRR
jgi:hypothetical protein